MSVRTTTYVVYGALLEASVIEGMYDALEPYMDHARGSEIHHHDDLCVIYDGMSGHYLIIGRVLAKSDESGHLEVPVVIPLPTDEESYLLRVKIQTLLYQDRVPKQEIVLRHLVLTHYS
jgi:hypothetical protein